MASLGVSPLGDIGRGAGSPLLLPSLALMELGHFTCPVLQLHIILRKSFGSPILSRSEASGAVRAPQRSQCQSDPCVTHPVTHPVTSEQVPLPLYALLLHL